jgi:DNA-3-methyladenine glycosylase II
VLKRIIAAVGPCTLQPGGDPFVLLVRSIVSQMISTKAAAAVFGRLQALMGPAGLSPQAVLTLGDQMRGAGLSGAKVSALIDLAQRTASGELPMARMADLSDEEVIEHLVAVKGIGIWTAQMFLIFCLGRLDVLPVGDLGFRAGVKDHYGLDELPKASHLRERAEAWRPYCSVATWYFWRGRGAVPDSGEK